VGNLFPGEKTASTVLWRRIKLSKPPLVSFAYQNKLFSSIDPIKIMSFQPGLLFSFYLLK